MNNRVEWGYAVLCYVGFGMVLVLGMMVNG